MTSMHADLHVVNTGFSWATVLVPEAMMVSPDQPAKVKFHAMCGEHREAWAQVEIGPYNPGVLPGYPRPTGFEIVFTFTDTDIPMGQQFRLRHNGRLTSCVNQRSSFTHHPQLRFVVSTDEICMSAFDIILEPEH